MPAPREQGSKGEQEGEQEAEGEAEGEEESAPRRKGREKEEQGFVWSRNARLPLP